MRFSRPLAAAVAVAVSPCVHATDNLEEVVVTPTKTAQTADESLAPVTVITREDIEQVQPDSLPGLLASQAPGIDISNSGGLGKQSSLYMRGTDATHTLVLVDGIRIGSATTGTTALEHIPVHQIERIEVVRGPRSSLYGAEAIGGVIHIFTRRPESGRLHASAEAGTYQTYRGEVGTAWANENSRLSVNVNALDTEGFNALENAQPDDDGYRNNSISLQGGHSFDAKAAVDFSLLYAEGKNEYDNAYGAVGDEYTSDVRQNAGSIGLDLNPTSVWRSRLDLGLSTDDSNNFLNGEPNNDYKTVRKQLNWQNDLDLKRGGLLTLGIETYRDQIDSNISYTEEERDNLAAFGQWQADLDPIDLALSLRHDDNEAYGEHTTGSLSAGIDLSSDWRLTASYGTAFHAPTFNQLFYPGYGNPELEEETSQHGEFGIRQSLNQGYWSANVFRTDIEDLIGGFPVTNTDRARIDGLELELVQNIASWQTRTSLSFLNPTNRDTGELLENRVKRTLKINADRGFGNWQLGATVLAQSERAGGTYSDPVPGFATFDLRGGYEINRHLDLRAKLGNVLDKDYRTRDGYNQPGRTVTVTLNAEL